MAVYLANIALILFWRLFFVYNPGANPQKQYCRIVTIQWILVSGLRAWSVGADTYNYYLLFEDTKRQSWESVFRVLLEYLFGGQHAKDPGYTLFTKVLQILIRDYQLFLLVIAVIFMCLLSGWIYRYSVSPCTSYLLFSTLFYSFYGITGHRQVIATALICFLGYGMIRRRHFRKFALTAFTAFLIHKSSLVFVPLYFLGKLPVTAASMVLWLVILGAIALLGKRLYGPIALWLGYSQTQIDYSAGGAELYALLLILLCCLIWLFYPRIQRHRNDAQLLFHINAMTLLSGILVLQNQSFMRIQQYFSLFLMITIPELIHTVRREHRLMVYLLFGTVMILYLIHQQPQYTFFFLEGQGSAL